jgi:hypothetical protein
VDHTAKANVLAIRGSVSAANWAADGRWGAVKCPQYGGQGSTCNEGYIAVWNDCKKQAIEFLDKAMEQNPTYETVVTGHSLGATAAVYAVADVRAKGKEAKLVCHSYKRESGFQLTRCHSTPMASRAQATSSSQNGSARKRAITESRTQPIPSATHRPRAQTTDISRPSTGSRAVTGMRTISWCWKGCRIKLELRQRRV